MAVFRYIQLLGRKGFSRTALEYCKFLLSLDPSDPLCVRFMIDAYCIRAEQFECLLDLYTCDELKDHNLSLLPNFVYSVGLAKYYLEVKVINYLIYSF